MDDDLRSRLERFVERMPKKDLTPQKDYSILKDIPTLETRRYPYEDQVPIDAKKLLNEGLSKPVDWEKLTGIRILNADGWGRPVKDWPESRRWDEPISLVEFHARASRSTVHTNLSPAELFKQLEQ